jgi:hypothetical protein
MSSGNAITTGRAARRRQVHGARHDLGDAAGIVDLGGPLRHRAEHRAVVELLQRAALAHPALDLPTNTSIGVES